MLIAETDQSVSGAPQPVQPLVGERIMKDGRDFARGVAGAAGRGDVCGSQ